MTALLKYYQHTADLTLTKRWYREQVQRYLLEPALQDYHHDKTSAWLIGRKQRCTAQLVAKEGCCIAGLKEVQWLCGEFGVTFSSRVPEGKVVKPHTVVARLTGRAQVILAIERTLVNTVQRLSGIATTTLAYKTLARHVAIAATRKTLWGALDKRAVACGGGLTHRLGLYDSVMIKDNHLALLGETAWDILEKKLKYYRQPVILEVSSLRDWKIILNRALPLTSILFDNWTPAQIKHAVMLAKRARYTKILFEASGGITQTTVAAYAQTGVDVLSIGALTHSSKAANLSLEIQS